MVHDVEFFFTPHETGAPTLTRHVGYPIVFPEKCPEDPGRMVGYKPDPYFCW